MGYGDYKDLPRKKVFDKVLRNKTFNIAKISKYEGYQYSVAFMVYRFFDKKFLGDLVKRDRSETLATWS